MQDLAKGLRSSELPLLQYVQDTLARLQAEDSSIHAFLPEPEREARLLREAEELLAAYPEPQNRPKLFGVLIGVKDLFRVDGLPSQAGSQIPAEAFSGAEAIVISKLKQAGALVLGKTVSTEFAYFSHGPTRNPINPDHTPGGSSSGSAAAVAMKLCPIALGTQTIASVNRPAAYCGVFGFKPSMGRIATNGMFSFSQSADQIGYFCSELDDISFAAAFITDAWKEAQSAAKLKVLIPTGVYLNQADALYLEQFYATIETLRYNNVELFEADLFPDIAQINALHNRLIAAEFALNHHDLFAQYGDLYSAASKELYWFGCEVRQQELEILRQLPGTLRSRIHDQLKRHNANLLITPGATSTAPLGLESTGSPLMSLPFTHAGLPTLSIPNGFNSKGLPYSLQLAAAFGLDEFLISAAQALPSFKHLDS